MKRKDIANDHCLMPHSIPYSEIYKKNKPQPTVYLRSSDIAMLH